MEILKTLEELRLWKKAHPKSDFPFARGFVPTMGALHKGHMTLIEKCRDQSDKTLVSIFVNPIQFNNLGDFTNYPITLESDLEKCRKVGVDAVFCPVAQDMYPQGFSSYCEVEKLDQQLCGATRPGHFRGVCTVVLKLFNLVEPSHSYFGQKDFQQARILQQLTSDFNLNIRLFIEAIVREQDGLAMSSRNQRLSSKERELAPQIFKGLSLAQRKFNEGVRDSEYLCKLVEKHLEYYPQIKMDYLSLVDRDTLELTEEVVRPSMLAIACFLGEVRLIDNILLNP